MEFPKLIIISNTLIIKQNFEQFQEKAFWKFIIKQHAQEVIAEIKRSNSQ